MRVGVSSVSLPWRPFIGPSMEEILSSGLRGCNEVVTGEGGHASRGPARTSRDRQEAARHRGGHAYEPTKREQPRVTAAAVRVSCCSEESSDQRLRLRAICRASLLLATAPSLPGTIGTPARFIKRRASALLPIVSITSGRGPINVSPT